MLVPKAKPSFLVAWTLLVFTVLVLQNPLPGLAQPAIAEKGELDLSEWDWKDRPLLNLKGEWEFYWNQLLTPSDIPRGLYDGVHVQVPCVWNKSELNGEKLPADGYATYRLMIQLDDSLRRYAISNKIISSSFKLYINGALRYSAGVVGTSRETSRPHYDHEVVPIQARDSVEILVQVSNFDHRLGGLRDHVTFGLQSSVFRQRGLEIFISVFLGGSFLIMAIYHLSFYFVNRNDKSPLFFAMFCFVLCLRLAVTGGRPIEIVEHLNPSWELLVKTEFLTLYAGIGLFLAFFQSLFGADRSRKLLLSIYAITAVACVFVFLSPSWVYTRSLFLSETLLAIVFIYTVIRSVRAVREGNNDGKLFLMGFSLFMVTVLNDILFVNEIVETGHYFSFGLFLFIVTQAILMARKFSRAHRRSEELLVEVKEAKEHLEVKINERTNELRSQNEALRKLNTEMDNFVYSVSHDLKAPLASSLGLLNLLGKEKSIETVKEYGSMMKKSLNRLNEFIGEILDFSRNARLQVGADEISFAPLVESILSQYQFYENGANISKQVNVEQRETFVSDQQRINVVLNNLISNALKYSTTGENGDPMVSIDIDTNDQRALVKIADNGSGIREEHIDKVFDMFYRADSEKSGSGLGLYIVKETLDKINGSIELKSVYGEGTTVIVEIPNLANGQKSRT